MNPKKLGEYIDIMGETALEEITELLFLNQRFVGIDLSEVIEDENALQYMTAGFALGKSMGRRFGELK